MNECDKLIRQILSDPELPFNKDYVPPKFIYKGGPGWIDDIPVLKEPTMKK